MRRFDGWTPKTVTRHHYDDQGRCLKSVTSVESEWNRDEQALMLALAEYRSELCDGCGGHLAETTRPENDGQYDADGPYLCYRCEAIGGARARFVKDRPHVTNPYRWTARLRKPEEV